MSAVATGAANGARAANNVPSPTMNQENQGPRKQAKKNTGGRQKTSNNPRAPLSTIAGGRKDEGQTRSETDVPEMYDDIPENMYRPDKNDKGWIHREKLAKIENEELQAAGINLAKRRSKSREVLGGRARTASEELVGQQGEQQQQHPSARSVATPVEEAVAEPGQADSWRAQSQEQVEGDESAEQMYSSPGLKRSSSKIPVMTSSPPPTGSERKRTLSGSMSRDEALAAAKIRQTGESGPGSPEHGRSPSTGKARTTSIPGPKTTPTGRKASISTTNPAKATPASSAPTDRPRTRGNDSERPRTATNPPEGDPPWLTSAYQPDPMLPPDQQLLPTVARRLQQEQWEREGQIPKTYDREFAALAVHEEKTDNHSPVRENGAHEREQEQQPQAPEEVEQWPLKTEVLPPEPGKPAESPVQSASPSSATGGYSTMPRVASPAIGMEKSPRIGAESPSLGVPLQQIPSNHSKRSGRNSTTPGANSTPKTVQQHSRLQHSTEAEDEKVEKKGCCCTVM